MKLLHTLPREVFRSHARVPVNVMKGVPAAIPPPPAAQRGKKIQLRHGQGHGCGDGCGCVCDIQVAVNRRGVVQDASFVAKRVVLGAGNTPVYTSGGNLMLHPCDCDVVKSLGSIATDACRGKDLDTLRNELLFSPNASPAVLRTFLRRMGAPQQAAACVQVVEGALTQALTDRRYAPRRWVPTPVAAAAAAAAVDAPREVAAAAAAAAVGVGGDADADVDDCLAEVDFRDQYDYIA